MSLFDDPNIPLTQALALLQNSPSVSGFPITPVSVMGIPAFRRAVALIANDIARLSLEVIRERSDGSREPEPDHPAHKLVNIRPNDAYSCFLLKQSQVLDLLTAGNSFTSIERDSRFGVDPIALYRLDPQDVQVFFVNGEMAYIVRVDHQHVPVLAKDMLHFRNIGSAVQGISVIDSMRTALGLAGATQQFSAEYFRWAATPTMIIEVPVAFKNQEELDKLAHDIESKHCGLNRSHHVMIMRNGMKVSDWKITAADTQLIESRKMTIVDIANIVGCSANRLNAAMNTSYGSLEAEERSFLIHDIEPYLVMMEEEYRFKMLSEKEKQSGEYCIEFDRDDSEYVDASTQNNIDVARITNGMISVNEWRAKNSQPRIEDESADEYRMPNNLAFAEQLFAAGNAPPPVPVAPVPTDAPEDKAATEQAVQGEDYGKLDALLTVDLGRQLTRLRKAIEARANKPGFSEWLRSEDFGHHREVFASSIPFAAERVEAFVDRLTEELSHVLPEQAQIVLDTVDLESLKEELCN